MSIGRPRNLQLPLSTRTLLITDVTRLQPFVARGDTFRENIETLVSYNVCNDRMSTRLSLYTAGSFDDSNIVYDVFDGD